MSKKNFIFLTATFVIFAIGITLFATFILSQNVVIKTDSNIKGNVTANSDKEVINKITNTPIVTTSLAPTTTVPTQLVSTTKPIIYTITPKPVLTFTLTPKLTATVFIPEKSPISYINAHLVQLQRTNPASLLINWQNDGRPTIPDEGYIIYWGEIFKTTNGYIMDKLKSKQVSTQLESVDIIYPPNFENCWKIWVCSNNNGKCGVKSNDVYFEASNGIDKVAPVCPQN